MVINKWVKKVSILFGIESSLIVYNKQVDITGKPLIRNTNEEIQEKH